MYILPVNISRHICAHVPMEEPHARLANLGNAPSISLPVHVSNNFSSVCKSFTGLLCTKNKHTSSGYSFAYYRSSDTRRLCSSREFGIL